MTGNGLTILDRPVVHVGFVVKTLAAGVDFWVRTFGAGPFYVLEDITFERLHHPPGPAVFEHSAAFGAWGNIVVELQEIYALEPLATLGPRFAPPGQLNHVAYIADDLAEEGARLDALGCPLLIHARTGPAEFTIHDAPMLGHTIEVHKDVEIIRSFHTDLARAADGWDGTDPLRPVGGDSREWTGV